MAESCIRFSEFKKELKELERGRNLDYTEESFILKGIIKSFELLFDLSWKAMKDIIRDYYGVTDYITGSPRETIEMAFKMELIEDNGIWISMLKDRNLLTHDYDESIAKERIKTIINQYFTEFKTFELRIDKLLNEHSPL